MTLGILCPGQGAQHPDMLSMLGGEPAAEAVLAAAQAVLGRDLQQLVSPGVTVHVPPGRMQPIDSPMIFKGLAWRLAK